MKRTKRTFVLAILLLSAPALSLAQDSSCLLCHGAQGGRLGDPVKEWQGSIHAQNGISCHNCHGGDPTDPSMEAMSPDKGFVGVPPDQAIPELCGQCHVGVLEDYRESAHGQALGSGGPQCATCHGNHAVRKADPDLINPRDCSRCHEYGRAEEIRSAIIQTEKTISTLGQSLDPLHRLGFSTGDLRGELFSLRNRFRRLVHSVDVEKVRRETAGFGNELEEIRGEIQALRDELARRRTGGGVVVVLLLAAAVVSLFLRRSYSREENLDRPH